MRPTTRCGTTTQRQDKARTARRAVRGIRVPAQVLYRRQPRRPQYHGVPPEKAARQEIQPYLPPSPVPLQLAELPGGGNLSPRQGALTTTLKLDEPHRKIPSQDSASATSGEFKLAGPYVSSQDTDDPGPGYLLE